jgi:flagellar L-ring protein precursor FlgH
MMKSTIRNLFLLSSFCLLASSCSNTKSYKKETTDLPKITQEVPLKQPALQSSSLWKGNSSSFLSINKGWKVGDIVKINVKIQGNAKLEGDQTNTNKKNISNPLTRLFGSITEVGLGILGTKAGGSTDTLATGMQGKIDGEFTGGLNSTRTSNSTDRVSRKESVNFEIAVVVKEVLISGNLVIDGTKEINVNGESRKMYVQGIIRPKDIDQDNCIDSSKVADAKIAYGIKEIKLKKKR